MKRLFGIKAGNRVLPDARGKPLYFDNKARAKAIRNKLNEVPGFNATITVGPDHKRYHG